MYPAGSSGQHDRYREVMADDEDWVGTPPEGRYSRDRADPDFWSHQRPLMLGGAGLVLIIIVLVVVALV